jgi:hypothetical protein
VPAAVDQAHLAARAACTKLAVDGSSGVPQTQPGRITTVAIWVPLAAWAAWSARVLDAAYPEQRGCCSGQLSSAPVTGRGLPSRLVAAPR